jgi:hypothetical protein
VQKHAAHTAVNTFAALSSNSWPLSSCPSATRLFYPVIGEQSPFFNYLLSLPAGPGGPSSGNSYNIGVSEEIAPILFCFSSGRLGGHEEARRERWANCSRAKQASGRGVVVGRSKPA